MSNKLITEHLLTYYDPSEISDDENEALNHDFMIEDALGEIQTWIDKQERKYFYCWINDFGWRKASGHTIIKLEDAHKFISDILPKTDCTFYIYVDEPESNDDRRDENYVMRILNYHHDAPTGETYYLRPLTDKELEELE